MAQRDEKLNITCRCSMAQRNEKLNLTYRCSMTERDDKSNLTNPCSMAQRVESLTLLTFVQWHSGMKMACGVVVSMFDFHRSDRGSNPDRGGEFS